MKMKGDTTTAASSTVESRRCWLAKWGLEKELFLNLFNDNLLVTTNILELGFIEINKNRAFTVVVQ